MAIYGVSIEKEIQFHGKVERISNSYFYSVGFAPVAADFISMINQLADAEKLVHGSGVAFKLGRVWSAGGSPAENQQEALVDLTGAGSMPTTVSMASELTVLVQWECAREDIRGRKVYLSKYIRSQGLPSSDTNASLQRGALSAASAGPFKTYADNIEELTLGASPLAALCSEKGRFPLNVGNAKVDPFVRNRNIRYHGRRPKRTPTGA